MDFGPIDLDHTLSCGQAFRWEMRDGRWRGIVSGHIIEAQVTSGKLELRSTMPERALASYFRADDDYEGIISDIGGRDAYVRELTDRFYGLRLLRQDPWECAASYILATYANVPRIRMMVERVCRTFGSSLGGEDYAFPTPEQILARSESAATCGLGYRCSRFVQFAERVHDGELDLVSLRKASYEECTAELLKYEGIGSKVADCVAVFSLDQLAAFPIDVRIGRVLEQRYGTKGSYRKLGAWARDHFGPYAGYAQEFLYYAEDAKNRRELTRSGS